MTNDSGIYYLEGLEQGEYRINVSGLATKSADCKSACDDRVRITPTTNPVIERNLIVPQQPTSPPKSTTSFNRGYVHRALASLNHSLGVNINIQLNY